jgi:hypothetical protein
MRVSGSRVIHLLLTLIRLLQPSGTRSVVAESLLNRIPAIKAQPG